MIFEFDQLSANQRYHLITQTVVPRPIAWILTRNTNQSLNLAPFSYFAPLNSNPPLLVVSIGNKDALSAKDTKQNLESTGECVLHIPAIQNAEAVNSSAATLAYGDSEVEQSALSCIEFTPSLPRIKEAPIAMHCKLREMHSLGAGFDACYLEITKLYVDEHIVEQDGDHVRVDNETFNPLGRLGGHDFAKFGGSLTIKRPQ